MIRYITELPSSEWENSFPRPVVLLGSTGSIGVNTLRIIEKHPDLFQVVALAGGRNVERLIEQALRWRPPYLGIQTEEGRKALLAALPSGYEPEILVGPQGYAELASLPEASTILSAQMGAAGLRATMAAAEAGKVICLANKESLVLAGGMLRETCARTGAVILPVDSEHNAVFQGLRGRNPETVRRIILTASGGPFRGKKRGFLATVTPAQALKHPNWSMGRKITIDSASMMNKALEVIEARWLFDMPAEKIDVLIHPQSVIHSMVEYADGAVMAQLGTPDMRLPILYAMSWPERLPTGGRRLDFTQMNALTFEQPDNDRFPGLRLAYDALAAGGSMSAVLNGANEVAVDAFLHEKIPFGAIARLVEETMQAVPVIAHPTLEQVFECDRAARQKAAALLARFGA